MKYDARFWVGTVLGLIVGGLPLVVADLMPQYVDPFDYGISYVAWIGGSMWASLAVATSFPPTRWDWGFVFAGFFAAHILLAVPKSQIPPFTIVFAVIIGLPPALAGAFSWRETAPAVEAHRDTALAISTLDKTECRPHTALWFAPPVTIR